MPKIVKIHHVAVIVEDIEKSLLFWRDALGMTLDRVNDVPEQNARIAFLPAGEAEVELVQPVGDESGLARFLNKKGAGMHHICIQVEGIGSLLEELMTGGVRLINSQPQQGENGKLFAFVHPESTGGVLVELYEISKT